MTTRSKTVEYVFATNQATLAPATKRTLTTTLYLPESSKSFKSVTLEIGCTDDVAAASSATSFALEIKLGSEAADSVTVTDTVTHSGESSVHHVSRDVTAYFTAEWAGSSMAAEASITVGANVTNNHWAKLIITYEYDDESTTHVKTIWYPIESTRDVLTDAYQTLGGATAIPAIKGGASILPEDNVTVRQVWVELIGNQGTDDASDFALDVRLTTDATEQLDLYRVNADLATPAFMHAIWDVTSSDLDVAQPLEAKIDSAAGPLERAPQICGFVGITYEFEPATTETVWNSLKVPAFDREDQHGATTSARKTVHVRELWVEEPATISLQPSQVFAFYSDNDASGTTLSLWVGGQSPRSFVVPPTGAPMVVGQRMDPRGTSGLGIELARGRNTIKIQQFANAADAGAFSGLSGYMLVNYTSGKAEDGVGVHNQTRHFALGWYDADATVLEYSADTTAPKTPAIPEATYFLNGVAMQAAWLSNAAAHQGIRVQAQRAGEEGPDGDGAGWANLYHGAVAGSAENWLRWTTSSCGDLFRRWAADPDTSRMDIEASRRWMVLDAAGVWVGAIGLLVTWHGITRTASGTIRGTASDGAGLTVSLSRSSTGEKVLEAISERGGYYEADWYDDTEPLIADVYEDATHMGRSAPFHAA